MDIDFSWAIERVIYGGSDPGEDTWHAIFAPQGLIPPLYFVTSTWSEDSHASISGLTQIGNHRHLAYWVTDKAPELSDFARASLVCSQGHKCEGWADLLFHWRQSILDLREQQLSALQALPDTPTPDNEAQARLICQSMMGDMQADIEGALTHHAKLLLALHNNQLNVLRNNYAAQWFQFQQGYGEDQRVSYLSVAFMQVIADTANLTVLMESYIQHCLALHQAIIHINRQRRATQNLPPALHDALAYLQQHFQQPISLKDIASHCGFSTEHMARLFKQHTQRTALQHLTDMRLDWAAEKLEHSDMSVTDIAFSVGFGSVEHFVRQFKRYKGNSPKRYRLAHPSRSR